jgi:hypothetical protein
VHARRPVQTEGGQLAQRRDEASHWIAFGRNSTTGRPYAAGDTCRRRNCSGLAGGILITIDTRELHSLLNRCVQALYVKSAGAVHSIKRCVPRQLTGRLHFDSRKRPPRR